MNRNLILVPMIYHFICAHTWKPRTRLCQPFIDANAFVVDMKTDYVRLRMHDFCYYTSQNELSMVCSEHKTRPYVE